jgi:hypothetical protein
MTDKLPVESGDSSSENPFQTSVEMSDESVIEGQSVFWEFFPVLQFSIWSIVSLVLLFFPVVLALGALGLFTSVLAMFRSWFWIARIRDGRRKGFDYPTPTSKWDLFGKSLLIGFCVSIVWPIAFVATCIPLALTMDLLGNSRFAAGSQYASLPLTFVIFMLPIVISTLLCTWLLRATLPPLPKANE